MDWYTGTVLAGAVLLGSVLSVEMGLSAAIIELSLGVLLGNVLGIQQTEWIRYLAGFGGILLTFLAGAEVDLRVLREQARASLLIGGVSFLAPFLATLLVCRYALAWTWPSAALAGIALSPTSLAVVYVVLVETGLTRTGIGKLIMAATFVTNFGTAAGLSLCFMTPTADTGWFWLVSIGAIALAPAAAPIFLRRYGGRVIEPEIKLLFFILLLLMFLADRGRSHAVLPVFVLGLVLSPAFRQNRELQRKLRVVAFAFITPIFFINGGLNLSLPLLADHAGLFLILLAAKSVAKAAGVFLTARLFVPREAVYTTLLMSTGLTLDIIAALFGYHAGLIDQTQFSVLVAAVVASAIVPTFFAQGFFHPSHALEAPGSEVEPELLEGEAAAGEREEPVRPSPGDGKSAL